MTCRFRSTALAAMATAAVLAAPGDGWALDRQEVTFKVFQFPKDQIPRIDGDAMDWSIVPESYVVGTDQLTDNDGHHPAPDPKTLDVRARSAGSRARTGSISSTRPTTTIGISPCPTCTTTCSRWSSTPTSRADR